jgi:phage/plasmid-like protein (TIGR03299 family)
MAHEFESGFFVAQAAWHGLGTVLEKAPTTKEAIVQAGLDWQVIEEPVYQVAGEQSEATLCKKLVRDCDRRVLGTVNYDYVPLQNQDAFRWFDPLLANGGVELEAAGSLQQGRRIWVLATIVKTEAAIVPGDWVRPYLLLHNSHDGSTAVWIQFTPFRVVCWNTLSGAAHHRFGDLWQKKAICIPHTLDLKVQLARIQDLVDLTKREFEFSVAEYQTMASQELNHELLATYMGHVLGTPNPTLHPAWHQLVTNFESGLGNQGRTLWDAYNAVTEWLDHQRGRSAAERLESTWFGASFQLRTKAHQVALDLIRNTVKNRQVVGTLRSLSVSSKR